MLKDRVDLQSVRRVLVTKLRHHGDVLLASPVFSVLKSHAPHVEVDALRRIGVQPGESERKLCFVPGEEAEREVGRMLGELGLAPGSYIHVHPASRWQFKCWPAERVAALCDALAAKAWPIVLTAAPDANEKALIAEVRAARDSGAVSPAPTIDLSGQLSLKELAALTAQAKLFVGVDSAPMHIAAAMGTPVVAIFGPSGDQEWGPWGGVGKTRHRVVASMTHPCRPCGLAGCNDSKVSACLTTLPVAQVLAACEELL